MRDLVNQIKAPSPHTRDPLYCVRVTASDGAIGRVSKSLADRSSSLAEQLEKVEEREAAYKARLEKQYSALDVKLNAFKATQAYLEQQIKMWTNQNND